MKNGIAAAVTLLVARVTVPMPLIQDRPVAASGTWLEQ
jgi:hypothetical protein